MDDKPLIPINEDIFFSFWPLASWMAHPASFDGYLILPDIANKPAPKGDSPGLLSFLKEPDHLAPNNKNQAGVINPEK
jgi:hypothetical protein